MQNVCENLFDFDHARHLVSYVVDDALNGRKVNTDVNAIATDKSVLVGWNIGGKPIVVAVNSYLGVRLGFKEASEIAKDYLWEIGELGLVNTNGDFDPHFIIRSAD